MNTPPRTAQPSPRARLTRQRRLVLEILQASPGHMDAAAIFQQARQRDEHISLATVYRALAFLKEARLVEENRLGEDHGHFETVHPAHHYHFTCTACGQVIEFEAAEVAGLAQEFSRQRQVSVTEIHFDLRGLCAACQQAAPHR